MSDLNLGKLYKLIEYILLSSEISLDEVFKSLIDLNTLSISLNGWCLSNAQEQVYSSICDKSFKIMDEAIDAILKYIVTKFFSDKIKLEKDVISNIYVMISKIINTIKLVIENTIIIQEEKILCKVIRPIAIGEKIIEKGYTVLLPMDSAIILSSLGYIEPIYILNKYLQKSKSQITKL